MGRFQITYPRRDPVGEAGRQVVSRVARQPQTSAYAAARFSEWAANAQQREQLLNARVQQAESEAELAGAQFRYNFWKDNELRRQTTAYYTAMPALQESLKQAGIYPGSQRYAAEMSAFAAELPDAVTHNEAIRNDLKNYAKVDATAGEISDKIKTFKEGYQTGTGQVPTKIHVGANNEITGEAGAAIPEKDIARYSRLQGAIELHQSQADTQLKDDMAHNRQNMPYAKQADLSAAKKEASFLEKAYPTLATLGQGNQVANQAVNTANPAAVGVTPTPTPTPQVLATPSPTPAVTPIPSGTPTTQASLDEIFGQRTP